jgi:rare lipoprotein A
VTNLRNNRSIILRINDRGPSIPGRMLDVSKAAAGSLGFINAGLARVRVELVHHPNLPKLPSQ